MKNLSKSIIIFCVIFFCACEKYYVGYVNVGPSNLGEVGKFNYSVFNDRVVMKGSIKKELFVGDLYPVSLVRKIEELRNPNIKKDIIKNKNTLSVARLVGNKGNIVECFVKQKSLAEIRKGGIGRCYYLKTGDSFNISFEKL